MRSNKEVSVGKGWGWGTRGVFQRRELAVMQSHRALLSALNTSISVCRGQKQAVSWPDTIFRLFSCQHFTKTSKRWQDEEVFLKKLSMCGMYSGPICSWEGNCTCLPWCPGWTRSSLDLATPAAWTQRHGSLHKGGLRVKHIRQIGTFNSLRLHSLHLYLF